jgi:hypothetical protein
MLRVLLFDDHEQKIPLPYSGMFKNHAPLVPSRCSGHQAQSKDHDYHSLFLANALPDPLLR